MKTQHTLLIALAGCLLAGAALAAEPVSASAPTAARPAALNDSGAALTAPDLTPYLGELEEMKRLQRENAALKLKLEQSKLQADLKTLRGSAPPDTSVPYVVALSGVGKAGKARVGVAGYGEQLVQAGSRLSNGWTIVAISDNGVTARSKAGKRVELPFFAPPEQFSSDRGARP